jgi:hypothetical protein
MAPVIATEQHRKFFSGGVIHSQHS